MKCVCLFLFAIVNASMNPDYWSKSATRLAKPIVYSFNQERRDVDLSSITYDYQFNDYIFNLKTSAYFENRTNIVGLMDDSEMKYWKSYGYNYAFSYPEKANLGSLLKNAKLCYDPWKCSKEVFTHFKTCIEGDCNKAHQIYPFVYMRSLSRISCIRSKKLISCYARYLFPLNDFPFDD